MPFVLLFFHIITLLAQLTKKKKNKQWRSRGKTVSLAFIHRLFGGASANISLRCVMKLQAFRRSVSGPRCLISHGSIALGEGCVVSSSMGTFLLHPKAGRCWLLVSSTHGASNCAVIQTSQSASETHTQLSRRFYNRATVLCYPASSSQKWNSVWRNKGAPRRDQGKPWIELTELYCYQSNKRKSKSWLWVIKVFSCSVCFIVF